VRFLHTFQLYAFLPLAVDAAEPTASPPILPSWWVCAARDQ
jgi:hypothetical protein